MEKFEDLLKKLQAGDQSVYDQVCNILKKKDVLKDGAKTESFTNVGDKKLADCDGVTDVDFRNLNLDKEITVKKFINIMEDEIINGKNRIGKRLSELYRIAHNNYSIMLEVSPAVMEELDNIPLDEMNNYVSIHEFHQNYNLIHRFSPTFGSLLRKEISLSSRPKLFEITIVKWQRFILDNIQDIISNRKEFITIVDYPLHYDASRSIEENLKIAYLEIADTLGKRVDNKRYNSDKCARWAAILKMKNGENKSLDEIAVIYDLTRERVRQILSEITDTLLRGDVFCENIKLNPALFSPATASVSQVTQAPSSEEQQPLTDLPVTDEEENDNNDDNWQNTVFKVGCTWEFIQDLQDIMRERWEESEKFNDYTLVHITDRVTPQVCIVRKENMYGIYTLDHTNGFGGPGTWCSPTVNPFPYDEVKYCAFPCDYEYGVFAFRIGDKWGIIKVVDGSNEEIYDVEYLLTKRRIVVPCEYRTLEDAEHQLRESYDWEKPFKKNEEPQTAVRAKRDVKKGTGRDKIRVTFPDGMVIEDSVVWKTMAKTIKRLGVQRVEKLKIPGNIKRNILLVDTHPTQDIIYKDYHKEIEPGYYLLTYNNTEQKAVWLERISDELHANLKIEIIC